MVKDYTIKDIVGKSFWVEGFLEYVAQTNDTRYTETYSGDFVTWLEMLNAIISTIVGTILIIGISYRQIGIMILVISGIQIYGTILYFVSYYTKIYVKLKDTKNNKLGLIVHLIGMNMLWIIFQ